MIMTRVSGTRSFPSTAIERVKKMSAMSDISLFWGVPCRIFVESACKLFSIYHTVLYNHEKAINEIKNLTVVYRAGGQWTVTGGKQTGIDDHAFALAAAIHAADREDDVNWLQDFL